MFELASASCGCALSRWKMKSAGICQFCNICRYKVPVRVLPGKKDRTVNLFSGIEGRCGGSDVSNGAAPECMGREIPEKTRRPAVPFGTIPTRENPRATLPRIEPGSPWRIASSLNTTSPRPPDDLDLIMQRSEKLGKLNTILVYTRKIAQSKYRNRIRLARASHKQYSDTYKTQYDRAKRCRERKINIKASERVNERRNARAGERKIPEKTCRPAASSSTIPTCENPGVTQQGIEPGSPWWMASRLTARPPRPLQKKSRLYFSQQFVAFILEKTRRPSASSGTIPTCGNPEATPLGIKPVSPRWEASSLTATPPRPPNFRGGETVLRWSWGKREHAEKIHPASGNVRHVHLYSPWGEASARIRGMFFSWYPVSNPGIDWGIFLQVFVAWPTSILRNGNDIPPQSHPAKSHCTH
ncbi:hypothetical protein PR048_000805, partial [Dryococelus australis]